MMNLIRRKHYSIHTERSYLQWVKRFIFYHGVRYPQKMGTHEVERFLTYLAFDLNVAASTQNQALNALVFLYKQALKREFACMENISRAKRPQRLPTVFSKEEIMRLLPQLDGILGLPNKLIYGAGLRVAECLRLRVQDVEFEVYQINFLKTHTTFGPCRNCWGIRTFGRP